MMFPVDVAAAPERRRDAVPAVAIDAVSISFAGLRALDGVDASIGDGQAMGLIGPNGSGKTTLLNVISRTYRQTSGTLRIFGQSVDRLRPHQMVRMGVSRTFQHMEMPQRLTALEATLLGRHLQNRSGIFSYSFALPFLSGKEQRQIKLAYDVLDQLGVAHVAHQPFHDLPYGIAKRIDLARALLAEPRLLLLDEPAAGLNERERDDLLLVLESLKTASSMTLVVVEHDMNFITRLCDQIMVLSSGRKVFDGPTDELATAGDAVRSLLGIVE